MWTNIINICPNRSPLSHYQPYEFLLDDVKMALLILDFVYTPLELCVPVNASNLTSKHTMGPFLVCDVLEQQSGKEMDSY